MRDEMVVDDGDDTIYGLPLVVFNFSRLFLAKVCARVLEESKAVLVVAAKFLGDSLLTTLLC